MRLLSKKFSGEKFDAVFFGGGTPSIVPPDLMRGVTDELRRCFALADGAEFSSEANPGTLTDEWLDVLTEAGLNRLSIGVQAIQPRLLSLLGRIHDFPQAKEALAMARRHGVANLNADAMFALPTQTAQDYLDTLQAFCAENVTHISAYSLILEEGTQLKRRVDAGELQAMDDDAAADMLSQGVHFLEDKGYHRYEISNFAKDGFACRHNLGYWQGKPYLGLGVSAASCLPCEPADEGAAYVRRVNTADLNAYHAALAEERLPMAERTPILPADAAFETLMLGLRTAQGVDCAEFARLHGFSPMERHGRAIARLTAQKLMQPVDERRPRLALTEAGLAVQNSVLMLLMDDEKP